MSTAKKKMRSGVRASYSKAAEKRGTSLDWHALTFLGGWLSRSDGRTLFVYVAPKRDDLWFALAVEGPSRGDPLAVLDDHGHRMIGEFATGEAAQRAAESFARKWRVRRATIEECACGEVAA